VDNWDGEGNGEDAVFTFAGARKPAEADLASTGAHAAGSTPGTTTP
jgi:ATP-dependent Clp protease ATP-binding subunit ClpC